MSGYPAHEGCGGLMMLPAAAGLPMPTAASGVVYCTTCFPKLGLIEPGGLAFMKAREASREAGVVDLPGELGGGHLGPAGRLALHHAICGDVVATRRKRTAFSLLKALLLVDAEGCPTEAGRALAARIGISADTPPRAADVEQRELPIDLSFRKGAISPILATVTPPPDFTVEAVIDPGPTPDRWHELALQQADRFWSKVDKSGDCWIWTAGRSSENYGKFQINEKGWRNGRPVQKHVIAHRLAWELTHGPVADDLVVMHICDNPPCCNPSHLRPGTQGENVRDCASKGRIATGDRHGSRTKPERVMRGATHYKATIGEDEVHKIRAMAADGMRACDIARSLGVKVNVVRGVRDGRSWKSVPVADRARARPLISWAGGKGKLLKGILPMLPPIYGRYFEPFAGGAALFFRLRPTGAYLADANPHLVRIYRAVRDHADDVIAALREHKNDREYYDGVKADFNGGYGDDIWRAAALMYMNKAGFNGVCRFNKAGEYNVPFGDGEPKTLCDSDNIRACSALLQESIVEQADFRAVEELANPGDLVFLDSPYLPEKTGSFVSYTKEGFSAQDHEDVAAIFSRLAARGVHVLASNSDTPKVREMYAGFEMRQLTRANSVNSKGSARGGKTEILILGGTWTPRGAS